MITVIVTACSLLRLSVPEAKTEIMCLQTKGGGKMSFSMNTAGQLYIETIESVYLGGASAQTETLALK